MYLRHPTLSTPQVLVLRSVFSAIIILLVMNVKTSYYMFKSIPKEQIQPLLYRIAQGIFNMFSNYFAIKYFPLVSVSLVSNISPLLVALFSYILYKVALQKLDIINLIISFIGVTLLITGTPEKP